MVRDLYGGISGVAAGACGGLAAGFVPCWIIAAVGGFVAGGWFREDQPQRGLEAAQNWYWLLWILCALFGMGVGFMAQLEEKWLANAARDEVVAKWKCVLISAPAYWRVWQ
jgi:hypothetical protein